MGKLICDFLNDPKHPNNSADVQVDAASFAIVQKAVEDHLAAVPVGRSYGVLGQNSPTWHITPQGQDWHISPGP